MAAPSRSSQFSKVHKVLKKHYQVVLPDLSRTVFEQLVFASCLENAHYDRAELAFAVLCDTGNFFDWNEIRVSTVRELSEAMSSLPDPPAAANRVKRVLQSVFESTYSFDLEELRKQNLGPAVEHLKKLDGTTPFTVAYVTQSALGGHAIPVDLGVLGALEVIGLVGEEDLRSGMVPGLERAIAKSKGIEFGSRLHQLGADFIANPYAPALHHIFLDIDADARQRLPKRRAKRRIELPLDQKQGEVSAKRAQEGAQANAKQPPPKRRAKRASGRKQSAEGKRKASPDEAAPAPKPSDSTEPQESSGTKEKPSPAKKKTPAKKKPDVGQAPPGAKPDAEPSGSAGLSKRKPR
jgi:endonuclease-3